MLRVVFQASAKLFFLQNGLCQQKEVVIGTAKHVFGGSAVLAADSSVAWLLVPDSLSASCLTFTVKLTLAPKLLNMVVTILDAAVKVSLLDSVC